LSCWVFNLIFIFDFGFFFWQNYKIEIMSTMANHCCCLSWVGIISDFKTFTFQSIPFTSIKMKKIKFYNLWRNIYFFFIFLFFYFSILVPWPSNYIALISYHLHICIYTPDIILYQSFQCISPAILNPNQPSYKILYITMRLTPDLIRRSQPYLNPLGQREIGFRSMFNFSSSSSLHF